jgi:hypothetical protein
MQLALGAGIRECGVRRNCVVYVVQFARCEGYLPQSQHLIAGANSRPAFGFSRPYFSLTVLPAVAAKDKHAIMPRKNSGAGNVFGEIYENL